MRKEDRYYYISRYKKRAEKSIKTCSYSLAGIIILLLLSILLQSCGSTKYIPVEKVRTEYINRTDTINKIDTLISEKETIIREADSSLVAKLGLQLKANDRAILILQKELEKQISKESEHKTDTVIKTETIQVPYPVEKKLSKWEQTKMSIGGVALGICTILALIMVIGFLFKIYKNVMLFL